MSSWGRLPVELHRSQRDIEKKRHAVRMLVNPLLPLAKILA